MNMVKSNEIRKNKIKNSFLSCILQKMHEELLVFVDKLKFHYTNNPIQIYGLDKSF